MKRSLGNKLLLSSASHSVHKGKQKIQIMHLSTTCATRIITDKEQKTKDLIISSYKSVVLEKELNNLANNIFKQSLGNRGR